MNGKEAVMEDKVDDGMTREQAEEIVTALEEWVDCRDDLHLARKRYDRGSPEENRAFLKCEAARERLIALMAGEETTQVQVGVPEDTR